LGEHVKNVHFMKKTNEWATPQYLFDALDQEFHFTLDPCATDENHKCARYFTSKEDGLSKSWARERVFMNPPYGNQIGLWIAKAFTESLQGALVVCLIPSRTDTRYWHDYVMKADEIRFIQGRVKFVGRSDESAPFPSAIVVFQPVTAHRCNKRDVQLPKLRSARIRKHYGSQLVLG